MRSKGSRWSDGFGGPSQGASARVLIITDGISKSVLGACRALSNGLGDAVCTRPRPAPASASTWHTQKEVPASYQHVLCQPPLFLGQPARHPQGKALLPEQRVPAVPAPEGDDLSAVGQVGDERELGVTGPAVHQRLCTGGHMVR